MKRTAVALASLALAAGWTAPVLAQLAPSSSAPIDVTADQLEVQNQKCLMIWRGNAEALQATSRLRADVLNLYAKVGPTPPAAASAPAAAANPITGNTGVSNKCGALERMEADGSVYYVTPQEVVKGDHATYVADSKTITVTGDVVISQGRNVVVGNRLVVNTDTGQATMESDVKGRGQPGRVRAVVYPSSNQNGGLFPTTGAAPAPKH